MILSLVIPVYRNEEGIPALVAALEQLDRDMDGRFEAVLVVDGSPDRSLELLAQALPKARMRSRLIALSTNFGSFAAIRAGLSQARGDLFAVMAADLQEPPELVREFRDVLQRGEHDVAVGVRASRNDPFGKRMSSSLFWGLYRKFVQRKMPSGGIDVFACNRLFRDHLLALPELNSTLVGLIVWMGFRRVEVPYQRRERRHGKSAWGFWRRVRYLLDSVFAFSDLPIRMLSFVGFVGMSISVALALVVLFFKMTGGIDVPGYAATVLVVTFFGGLNALGLGVIGEYTWRTLENTKRRPLFMVASQTDHDGRSDDGERK